MHILGSPASPYVAKVAMAARYAGIDAPTRSVETMVAGPELLAANPLGKIPALIMDDGRTVYDSRLITRVLDRLSGGKLVPSADPLPAELLEAHCDGMADCAVAGIYEHRMRPAEKVHQPWLDRQFEKLTRGLDGLPGGLPPVGDGLTIGGIALAAVLGYLALRYEGRWEDGRTDLVAWKQAFEAAHPDLAKLLPAG